MARIDYKTEHDQVRIYVVGATTRNLGLAPKCDMKHRLTNSKHRHIGAKSSVLWSSKYDKMSSQPWIYPDRAGRAHEATPDPLVGRRENTPLGAYYLSRHTT